MENTIQKIAFIGNHLPRQCGIATFTTDVSSAVVRQYPETDTFVIPVNDTAQGYKYPPIVRFELNEQELGSYTRAADFLNINDVDIVCLQHEFGIFGGPAGSHILALLNDLRMPVVTTLHTVLREPTAAYRKAMEDLCGLSDRLVVMSKRGVQFLKDIYKIPEEKIDLIHHGIPDMAFVDPNFHKDKFAVEGKIVLLTFGLLSPNKGIEYVIKALPHVLKKYPNVVYMVLGATHPHLKRTEGESYRLSLQRLVKSLGLESNVIFHNRFVTLEELCEFIGSADLYITPYLNAAQIVSGTLAYSVGCGKAVISTPYWYAEELLDEGRGVVVPFKSSDAIAGKVIELLENEAERHSMRKKAYALGRGMIWSSVAQEYMASFVRAREEGFKRVHRTFSAGTMDKREPELPPLNLAHLRRLTDSTGMIQHATYSVPNYDEGYCVDDNARGVVLCVLLEGMGEPVAEEARELCARYLAFLNHAFNPETGRFRNFLSYERSWLEEAGSDDCHARAMWALGTAAGRSRDQGLRGLASRLFEEALPVVEKFEAPRSWAFAVLGIMEYMRRFYGHRVAQEIRVKLGEKLLALYEKNKKTNWPWFEDNLTYCNAKIPHALIQCGQWLDRGDMAEAGLKTLEWLVSVQKMEEEHFVPIGCHGFYTRGKDRARFDQQPIEAHVTLSACLEAYMLTGDRKWYKEAQRAFDWYLGSNDLHTPLYNPQTGGCFDGLTPDRVNQNQGAESTLSFLLSLVEMNLAQHIIRPDKEPISDEELGSGEKSAQTVAATQE